MSRKNLPPFDPNEQFDRVAIGQALRMFREVSLMSQAALAEASGLSQSAVSNLESGKSFTVDNLNKAAKGLDVSVKALINFSFQIEKPTDAFREGMAAFEAMMSIAREANETEVRASARPFRSATTKRDLSPRDETIQKVIQKAAATKMSESKPATRA